MECKAYAIERDNCGCSGDLVDNGDWTHELFELLDSPLMECVRLYDKKEACSIGGRIFLNVIEFNSDIFNKLA